MQSHAEFPAPVRGGRQLTFRAVLTGMVLGAVLSTCNIYAGLKIGWLFNMSIAAALLSYGFWQTLHRAGMGPSWGLLENNINQTTASAAASIAGAGLVAPIPALTMITGQTLSWPVLAVWTFTVSLLGLVVAVGLRKQLLIVDRLPFPQGFATAETIREMYAKGKDALARVRMLLFAGGVAATLKLVSAYVYRLPLTGLPYSYAVRSGSALATTGISSVGLKNLTFALDPSLLMVAFGAIVGLRAGVSLLLGAVVGWGILAPEALDGGWATLCPPIDERCVIDPVAPWYEPLLNWLLWPGVAMMVTASLTAFAMSWRSIVASITAFTSAKRRRAAPALDESEVPRGWYGAALLVALLLAITSESWIFGIPAWVAAVGVALTFVLAVVAGRVSGETGITPIGAMGQVTQLSFGAISPGDATANLMAANVTGGAASQCADLLHDLKTGLLIGAWPRYQIVGQLFGAIAGALAGSYVYLLLVPDPSTQLLTPEFPAPAVATWKAVAEVFMHGFAALPPASVPAMIIAGAFGITTAVLEKKLPEHQARFVPSAASIGLAFVIPAWLSLSIFAGALLAFAVSRVAPKWSSRFVLVIAAGVVAGESLAGVTVALEGLLTR